jgi:hypothetical protein
MSARVILTYDDDAALPDDGRRYELYESELVMTPSPRTRHQVVLGNLYALMRAHVLGRGFGEVFLSPIDRTIQALRLGAGAYEVVAGLEGIDRAALPPLDGLVLDPAAVWR